MTPHVLIVAGSDSSGGAGIVRDVETVSAFGLRSSAAVTAVTVQTHARVERIEQMPPELVAEQMRAAFAASSTSSKIPPPPTPPHKGEGDTCVHPSNVTARSTRSGLAIPPNNPPPPCGEGIGVGVSRGQREPSVELHASHIASVKIGMLGTAATIEAVVSVLASSKPVPVLLDPVLASTSGRALLDDDAIDVLKRKLFPLCRLVTPNLHELALLTGRPVSSSEQHVVHQAKLLLETGMQAVLVKGGHSGGNRSVDLLLTADGMQQVFDAPRLIATMRGTGCMLASAVAANLALGETLEASVCKAKRHVFTRLAASLAA
nr:hydroxymethylpyrimidine/phosphomethylpyrimidine kinase [Aminobacter sp. HY435]